MLRRRTCGYRRASRLCRQHLSFQRLHLHAIGVWIRQIIPYQTPSTSVRRRGKSRKRSRSTTSPVDCRCRLVVAANLVCRILHRRMHKPTLCHRVSRFLARLSLVLVLLPAPGRFRSMYRVHPSLCRSIMDSQLRRPLRRLWTSRARIFMIHPMITLDRVDWITGFGRIVRGAPLCVMALRLDRSFIIATTSLLVRKVYGGILVYLLHYLCT